MTFKLLSILTISMALVIGAATAASAGGGSHPGRYLIPERGVGQEETRTVTRNVTLEQERLVPDTHGKKGLWRRFRSWLGGS